MRNGRVGSLMGLIGEVIYFAQVGARLCLCPQGTNPNLSYQEKLEQIPVHLHPEDVDMGAPRGTEKEDRAACLAILAIIVGLDLAPDPDLGLARDTVGTEDVRQNELGRGIVPLLDPARGRGHTIARGHLLGAIPQITLDLDLLLETVAIGLNSKRMKKSSSVQLPRKSSSTANGSREL
ncbi:hypothetical protein PGTUg99_006589 [Puccinia graminis f. sp. tritici]|uniref:Uncharacterized protein n=1 Tax=Puccinia graminis f. sp. tritici TaxID=56615 RepID=A0A5B0SI90_PUCGR|nr:hypothetical protein PGTUg99_006589 [Puccinia graminis f. sp. tritici]